MSHPVDTATGSELPGEPDCVSYLSDWRMADSIGTAVVLSVADYHDCRPTALPQLSTAIDPDALDTLLNGRGESVSITFRYAGCLVSLRSDGELTSE